MYHLRNILKESVSILPKGRKHLANMGEQLKLARLRRKPAQAALIINEIKFAVSNWQKIAKKWGIPAEEQTRMASAFIN